MQFNARLIRRSLILAAAALLSVPVVAQQKAGNKAISVERNKRDNTPSSIAFARDAGYTPAGAQEIFRQYLDLNPATDELRFLNTTNPGDGLSVDRFTQYYKGIKVEHGAYTITSKDGHVSFITGNFYKTSSALNIQPALAESAAFQKALNAIGADKYIWQDAGEEAQLQAQTGIPTATWKPKGELVYIEDFRGDEPDGKLHLAYRFDIYALQPLSRRNIYVDALTGGILFSDAILKHVLSSGASRYSGVVPFHSRAVGINKYYLQDTTRGGGVFTYNLHNTTNYTGALIDSSATTTSWADTIALDAHWGAEIVYDYWKNVRNRLSYDNLNSRLNSYVHYSTNYDNAYWDGTRMTYGDGSGIANGGFTPLTSLDVCGHEIGHGICQFTANLVYSRESGAMNEGLSDIWGAVIESYGDLHEVDAKAKNYWEIGEEIGATPLRSMANPKLYGQPDTYNGLNWVNAAASCTPSNNNDQCGVHTNSGVLNHWFYLLSLGGAGTNDLGSAFQVPSIGMTKGAQIVYAAEVASTSQANYANFRTTTINAASTIFGACSIEVEAVTRAWYAVGVGTNYTPCTPQISFAAPTTSISENAGTAVCPASKTINIPVVVNGPAIAGGSPVVTVTVSGGTAVSGVDYVLNNTTVTFTPGSTSQNISMTIFDNGSVDTDKYVDLAFTLAANSSNATIANVTTTERIYIVNDDKAPEAGGSELHTINIATTTSNVTSPFVSSAKGAHTQYIIPVQDLIAYGLRPNTPISAMAFNVTQKYSTQPFTGYTVKIGATALTAFTNAFVTGLTQVYTGNYSTTLGWDTVAFSTPYIWNGTSSIAIEICFTNAAAGGSNDRVDAYTTGPLITAYNSSTATAAGCSLAFSTNLVSTTRPVIRFTQDVPPTPVETAAASTRTWDIRTGQKVYFYSTADSELIGAVLNPSANLGCVEATVTKGGTGFAPAVFSTFVNRSAKEFTIKPTQPDSSSTYDAVLYFTSTELGAVNTANMRILKTNAATDSAITPANSQVVIPTMITAQNYTGFQGSFKGFSRFFLVDGNPALAVPSVSSSNGFIRVDNNPFHNEIGISYELGKGETAQVALFDVTGKKVFGEAYSLQAGKHQLTLAVGGAALAPGYYMLQVVRPSGVATWKLMKD